MVRVYQRIALIWLLSLIASTSNAGVVLNGISSYQDFGSEVFIGALYLEQPDNSVESILASNQEMHIEVRLTSALSKRANMNLWMQSIAINNSQDAFQAEAQNVVDLFATIKDQLQASDILKIAYKPGAGTSLSVNNTTLAENLSKSLFHLFLRSWIGPVPPSTEFRADILGTTNSKDTLIGRLSSIKPGQARVDAIAEWIKPEPEPEPEPELAEEIAEVPAAEQPPEVEAIPEPEPEPEEPVISVEALLAHQQYITNVTQQVYKAIRYPKAAVKRNHQGSVRLQLQLNRDGSLEETTIVQEARHNSLNKAALKAIDKAAPFDTAPESMSDDALIFTIPIAFRLVEE